MNSRIVVNNSFEYKRNAIKITAYGREYELPVRTTSFCDKQDEIDRELVDVSKQRTSAEVADILRRGVDLFLGEGEGERIFPAADDIDVDEIRVFYDYLRTKSLDNLIEYTQKYAPRQIRR
jgi:hypothetical protein